MSVITKQIELTPQDVIEAVKGFREEEREQVLAFLVQELPTLQPNFDLLDTLEPHPEEPPRTPEGDKIALAAVERMAGMIPISDPELARWLAESPDLSIYAEL
ncbi:MAG: hypothetical protein A2Z04_09620 [Chloroflexi bacterium RBG_16_57_9]|nr:MAG: hypothetical protein A2Z04_09620 [Chloroflexi bacterium RBG_16_57_9]